MGPLMDHKNGHISTNIQRQKLSIAVLEAAHECPSPERLDRTVFFVKRPPNKKINGAGIFQSRVRLKPYPCGVLIYKAIYIYICICGALTAADETAAKADMADRALPLACRNKIQSRRRLGCADYLQRFVGRSDSC